MVLLLGQIMVVLDISLKSLIVSQTYLFNLSGHLSSCKINKLIQAVLVQLAVCTLQLHHGGTFSSDNGGRGHPYKVTD